MYAKFIPFYSTSAGTVTVGNKAGVAANGNFCLFSCLVNNKFRNDLKQNFEGKKYRIEEFVGA